MLIVRKKHAGGGSVIGRGESKWRAGAAARPRGQQTALSAPHNSSLSHPPARFPALCLLATPNYRLSPPELVCISSAIPGIKVCSPSHRVEDHLRS